MSIRRSLPKPAPTVARIAGPGHTSVNSSEIPGFLSQRVPEPHHLDEIGFQRETDPEVFRVLFEGLGFRNDQRFEKRPAITQQYGPFDDLLRKERF